MSLLELNIKEMIPQMDPQSIAVQRKKEDLQKIKKACKDFESIFTYYLLKTMRQTIPENSKSSGISGKDTYYMLMDQRVAEELSGKGNGLGLQKMLFKQLTKNFAGVVPQEKVKQD
jgi:peptidoglycan hydrolase FlgJ